ncbi:HYR domain-containing protein, partial [Flavobacterium sp. PL02]|uniref:Ig-like domain-containing protein n=1 Tax=Flavobacterium sp. PL02 TaxID=3088354 RepID=UPI002B22E02A
MYNSTLKMLNFFKQTFFIAFLLFSTSLFSQICGTPGGDGPVTVSSSINTYYPVSDNTTLSKGAQSIVLGKVPTTDKHNNVFGTIQISAGDLILIIQMQDAIIDYRNDANYGSGNSNSGPDNLGGTGFTLIGNTGVFEYVIATNSVPLAGGNLTFKGTGTNGGTFNSFFNADATPTRGKRTFQIVRVPQYSNLKLTSKITTPPFNGIAGGVIAFNVSGTFDFNGFSIDGTARGFRGGYSPIAFSGVNDATSYVGDASKTYISGKGEGIAGTPRYMWDGYNQVDNKVEGMPAGSSGRGAPANAGGGGNDHNTGGGGGGNGGFGGLGGYGWQGIGGQTWPTYTGGGRPGFRSYLDATPELTRLIMGGGGGAGDANNAIDGVKGGVGGAIVLINAGTVQGNGLIEVNGGNGAPGAYGGTPDGAGGAGAGGTVLLNISNISTGDITINAKGGNGGNTENDTKNEHGPGGGGGGGIIRHNLEGTVKITTNVTGGLAGKTNKGSGTGSNVHGANEGVNGHVSTFISKDLPPNLQVNSNCFPILDTKVKSLPKASACNSIGEKVSYEIQIKNTGVGNAAGVDLDFYFPTGIEFDSATATYSADTTGPSGALSNTVTSKNNPVFGGFNIAQNGVVTIILVGKVIAPIAAGTYSSNAQALYFDPTRTTANPTRKITAAVNAYGTTINKKYEGVNQIDVPGTNFKGDGATVTEDDIKIFALPDVPTVEVVQSTCDTPTGTITVKTPANGEGISYTLKGINPVTAPVINTTGIFSGLVPNNYVVTTTNENGCTSVSTDIITINAVAGAPTTTGVSTCQGVKGSLKATSTCSGTIQWYTSASGGTKVGSGASFDPTTVTGLIDINKAGTTVFYAACGSGTGCRTATNFVINAIPTITGTTPAGRCDTGEVILGATASSGTINWYAAATGGTSLGTGTSFTTPSLTTTTTYYVDATDNGCTTATRTAVKASINTRPTINSTTEASSCGTAALTLKATASTGADTIRWYADPVSEQVLGTGAEFITPNLSTTTTYYVGATTTEGCTTTSRIAVAAVINDASTIVLTSGTQNPVVCTGTAIPTTVYTFGGSAKNAIVTNLPTELKSVVDLTARTVTISGTPTANANYTITTVGHTMPCPAATINGVVTMNASIPKPTLTTLTQPTCTTVTGSFEITNYNPTYTYTVSPSTGVNRNGATVTAPVGSYTVKATSGTCASVESVAVVINAQPATPDIPAVSAVTQPTCATATGSFTITNYDSTYTYTITPSTGVNRNGATVTAPAGSYTVKATLGTCISAESVAAVINAQPATPAMPTATEQNFCFVDAKKIKDLIATGSGIQWYNALTGGILYKETDLLESNTYYASQTTNGCESERIAVKVIVTETPIAGTLSGNQNICITENTAFSLSGGAVGGRWSSSNTAVATVNASTGAIAGVGTGVATIKYTVTGTGGCDDATAERVVTVSSLPTATITGTLEACLTTTLTAVTNAVSPSYVWYKDNSVINGETASTLVVTSNGDYKVKIISGSTFCEETSTASTVVVADTEKPVISCPATISQVADANKCGATVSIVNPTATDNCSTTFTFAGVRSDSKSLTDLYPVGTTKIVWTATDASGNTSLSCEQTITIADAEKPVKPILADVIAQCSATVPVPSTTDNCKGTITGTTADPLTYTAQGTYIITWSFDDGNGNIESAIQNIIIKDTEKPVITCPAAINKNADANKCGATVSIVNPTATDNCSTTFTFAGVRSDSKSLTDLYPVGTTKIVWTATDASGNTSLSCEQTVTITDAEKPVKPVLADVIAQCSATVPVPSTTDNCKGTITGTTVDPLTYTTQGTYTITWSFDDGNGKVESAIQNVIIKDTEKPVITCPTAISQVADANKCGATVSIVDPTATDNCSTTFTFAGIRSDSKSLTDLYPVGTTKIVWTATDASGNTSLSCEQTIIITDTEKPVISCPATINQIADSGQCGATVFIVNPTATDNCSATFTFAGVRSDSKSLTDLYPVGTTKIVWTATDASGNTSLSCEQTIIIT